MGWEEGEGENWWEQPLSHELYIFVLVLGGFFFPIFTLSPLSPCFLLRAFSFTPFLLLFFYDYPLISKLSRFCVPVVRASCNGPWAMGLTVDVPSPVPS